MTTITRDTDSVSFEPALVLVWTDSAEVGTLVHPIPGRYFPDVTLREAYAPSGTMRLLFMTSAEAMAAFEILLAASTFSATSDLDWMPAAFVPQGTITRAQQTDGKGRWVLEVGFQEIAPA